MIAILLIGVLGGVIGGFFGVGGGTIFVPALTILLGISQAGAQGISLAVMVPMSFMGAYTYYHKKNVHVPSVIPLMLGSLLGAYLGATVANQIDSYLLKIVFGCVLFLIGAKMFLEKKHE